MSDYIKREDAIEVVRVMSEVALSDGDRVAYGKVWNQLKDLPFADVAPVRHGRWESFEDVFMETCYQCSECGLSFYLADGGTPKENKYHYCPNCGAKMDGEGE